MGVAHAAGAEEGHNHPPVLARNHPLGYGQERREDDEERPGGSVRGCSRGAKGGAGWQGGRCGTCTSSSSTTQSTCPSSPGTCRRRSNTSSAYSTALFVPLPRLARSAQTDPTLAILRLAFVLRHARLGPPLPSTRNLVLPPKSANSLGVKGVLGRGGPAGQVARAGNARAGASAARGLQPGAVCDEGIGHRDDHHAGDVFGGSVRADAVDRRRRRESVVFSLPAALPALVCRRMLK